MHFSITVTNTQTCYLTDYVPGAVNHGVSIVVGVLSKFRAFPAALRARDPPSVAARVGVKLSGGEVALS